MAFVIALMGMYTAAVSAAGCSLDLDGDGVVSPGTDAVIAARLALGYTGDSVVANVPFSSAATRKTPSSISDFLSTSCGNPRCLDIDGDGQVLATTDALIFTRLARGINSSHAIEGITFAVGAARKNWTEIRNFLVASCGHVLPLPAFPGAQGSGAASIGGRNGATGRVIKVANTNDSGLGSLRACVEATGPRTCVFTIGGVIELESALWIVSPYLTVAGQTAPGGGITIVNRDGFPKMPPPPTPPDTVQREPAMNLVGIATHDVIWQYTRLRTRTQAICTDSSKSECVALFSVFSGYNIIADHNSLSWQQDDGYGVWRGGQDELRDITFSMSLIAEGIKTHSTGMIVGGSTSAQSGAVTNVDAHRNLTMNNSHRNPLMKNKSGRLVNNIFYNQNYYASQFGGGGEFDVIGNFYKRGPLNANAGAHEIQAFEVATADTDAFIGSPSLYIKGNQGTNQPNPDGAQWVLTHRVLSENGSESAGSPAPTTWQRNAPLPSPLHPILAEHVSVVQSATGSIVPTVGASRRLDCAGFWVPNRDSVDTRLINQYVNDQGITALPATEADMGGIPVIAAGSPCVDTDDDGLPDEWEMRKFGHLNRLPNGDYNGAGYSNLEAYLHGL